MELHLRHNQPILSSVKWGSGESSQDSEEGTGSGRPLPCSLDLSIDSDDYHWTKASRTGIRKKNPYHTSRTVCECGTKGLQQSDSRRKKARAKQASKRQFNKRNGTRSLPELSPGDEVLQELDHGRTLGHPAVIMDQCASRFCLVRTPQGQYRRNQKHLRLSPEIRQR